MTPLHRQTFMVADRCNLACTYCYYETGTSAYLPTTLAPQVYARWLAACLQAGHPAAAALITGGEPTLRPDLPELLDVLAEAGAETVLMTNGVRPRQAVVDAVLKHDTTLHVSVDHVTPDIGDDVRGGTRATLAGIRAYAEAGVRDGALVMVMTARNWHDVPAVASLAADLGWATEFIAVALPAQHPLSLRRLPQERLTELSGLLRTHAEVAARPAYHARLLQYLATGRVAAAAACAAGDGGIFVTSDGTIGVCGQRTDESLGSIVDSDPLTVLAAKAERTKACPPGRCVTLDCLVLV